MSAVELLGMAQLLGIIAVVTVLMQLVWVRYRQRSLLTERVRQRLQQRRDTGKQHRHLDQVQQFREVGRVRPEPKARRARDDDGGGDIGHEHRQHVLNTQRNSAIQRRHVIGVAQLFRRADGVACHIKCPLLITGRYLCGPIICGVYPLII